MESSSENLLAQNLYSLTIKSDLPAANPPTTSVEAENTDSGFVDSSSHVVSSEDSAAIFCSSKPSDSDRRESKHETTPAFVNSTRCIVSCYISLPEVERYFITDEEGDNDLLIALTNNTSEYHRRIAAFLIDNAPDSSFLNHRNVFGLSAIIIASMNNDIAAIRRLRLAGADPSLADYMGKTGLHHAASNGNCETLLALSTLISDAEKKAYKPRRAILATDLNVRDCEGKTPLHLAVERRQKKIIQILRNLGANPNLTENSSGRTALHAAVELGLVDCAAELLKISTIDVNARNYADGTPLDCAENLSDDDVRKVMKELLIFYGALSSSSDSSASDEDSDMDRDC